MELLVDFRCHHSHYFSSAASLRNNIYDPLCAANTFVHMLYELQKLRTRQHMQLFSNREFLVHLESGTPYSLSASQRQLLAPTAARCSHKAHRKATAFIYQKYDFLRNLRKTTFFFHFKFKLFYYNA